MSGVILKAVLSLCLPCLVLVAACDTGPAAKGADDPEPTVSSTASSIALRVFFPRQKAWVNSYLMALWRGELILDGEGCLRVRGDGSLVPVWPPGFGVEVSGRRCAS